MSGTVGRSNTRMFPSRLGSGTFGRKSPPTRSPSRRHRRDLRSTGEPSSAGASAASVSRRSRTRPVCLHRRRRPRPAASLRRIVSHSGGVRVGDRGERSRGQGASSRSGRASSGRSNPPPMPMGRCVRERAVRADASLEARRFGLSMRSSRASISPAKATTSCSERSPTTRCSTACVLPLTERDYRAHEFGDLLLIERQGAAAKAPS